MVRMESSEVIKEEHYLDFDIKEELDVTMHLSDEICRSSPSLTDKTERLLPELNVASTPAESVKGFFSPRLKEEVNLVTQDPLKVSGENHESRSLEQVGSTNGSQTKCTRINCLKVMPMPVVSGDVFNQLKTRRFCNLSIDEKRRIVNKGRPMPHLNLKKNENSTKKFKPKLYDEVPWLCGNVSNNKLYCWSCLLFSDEESLWNTVHRGYNDLNNLYNSGSRHEKSFNHINAYVDFKIFEKSERTKSIPDRQKSAAICRHNEKVNRNREILKRFIRLVCFLGMQELSFHGHNEEEKYIELAFCLGEFDENFQSNLKNSPVFKGTSTGILNNVIKSIETVMFEQIKSELSDCMYAAILLDETSNVSCCSQLSIIVRYVKDGEICERFIGFADVSNDRSARAISNLCITQLGELDCIDKLVAVTYDGAVVTGSDLNGLLTNIRETVPDVIFIHCYAHKLNFILSQAVCEITECNNFFSVLRSLSSFFTSSVLDRVVRKYFPELSPTRWSYSSQLVETVKENEESILNFLKSILENPKEFDDETKNSARGLFTGINSFDFNFLLEMFHSIFPFTERICNLLQSNSMDITYRSFPIMSTIEELKFIKNTKFAEIWALITKKDGEPLCKRKPLSPQELYSQLFDEIIDNILLQMNGRFSSLRKLKLLELLDCERFHYYVDNFPQNAFESLKKSYNAFFEFPRLHSELRVLYSRKVFAKKKVPDLLKYLLENEMQNGLKELYKLTNLILTIPISKNEESFSALKRIKSYLKNSQSDEKLSNLALISIEKKFLKKQMDNRESFYNLVIEEFCKKTGREEFRFK